MGIASDKALFPAKKQKKLDIFSYFYRMCVYSLCMPTLPGGGGGGGRGGGGGAGMVGISNE